MQPLRILHVTPYFADAWAYGGIPRLAHSLTRGLVRRGHRVTVCTTDAHDERSRLARRSLREPQVQAIDTQIFPNLSNRLAYRHQLFWPIGLSGFLRRAAGSFDVAHLHACRNAPGVVAAHHLHRAGVPYVLVPNGTASAIERRQLAKHLFDVVAGRRVLRNAARIVAVTETEREQLRCLGVPDSKIRVVPNPVDLDEFKEPCRPGSFRRRHGVDGRPLIVFLGKITPRKRVDLLVRAFAHVRREAAHLVIAGNDMGGGAEARALAASLGVLARCTFTGLLRGRDRLEALADADVVVYPSQDEIFGLVPLEALLAGTPVVVAGDSGCGEVIRGLARGGQVVPVNDHIALANAIDAVLAAPAAWRAAAADASSQVRARFGEPVVAHSYERLYREMVRR